MPEKFTKPYDPSATEGRLYEAWEKSGLFNPDECVKQGAIAADAEPFAVALPPPNVTGVLHLGHAYEDALQDAVVRFERMRGKKALFVPGADSAAIATQSRVEKDIQKAEGKSRHDIGREELVRRVGEFATASESTILNQVRRMGASLDWSRYAYAMDEPRYRAVMEAFIRMHEAGLIYRGYRIVNWDPKGQTTISDDEIVHEERTGTLYTFRYGREFPIPVATTRLETKVGDVAVAVHPSDERYKRYVGLEYDYVFCDVPIHLKVVADAAVDPAFGTGALGVTPAHSQVDWEIADRHLLSHENVVINEYAKMTVPGRLHGKKVGEARELIAEWLRSEGLLESEEAIAQSIATAERTGGVIEPLPKLQWFVAVDTPFTLAHSEIPGIASGASLTLKELMRKAVEGGGVLMPQEGFRNAYLHWIDNLRDWCISRQIWFGHRIPVWYKGEDMKVQVDSPGEGYEQEPDVLDTWFSSQLWTFSTLGWPHFAETATRGKPGPENDLATYHPTAFMSPAYEILNLWVSRMILASGFLLGQVPFRAVMIHGLVRDSKGRKFSKSLGNGGDPLEMIEKYGADALRMGLLVGSALGHDIRFDEQKVKGYKHFANKLWNIARFVLENAEGSAGMPVKDSKTWPSGPERYPEPASPRDQNPEQELLARLDMLTKDVTDDMEHYRIYLAAEKLYHYVWHELADKILEESKPILNGDDPVAKASRQALLLTLLDRSLRLLHPFMPFVTEEIWQSMPTKDAPFLMVAKWPASVDQGGKDE